MFGGGTGHTPWLVEGIQPCRNPIASRTKLYRKSGLCAAPRNRIGTLCRVLSPHMSPVGPPGVLLAAAPSKVVLYTLFQAENFATGASSIGCLQRLTSGGVTAYHLPGLHAKMLLIPGRLLTVGSQNLTSRGTQNLEASLLVEDQKLVIQAEKESDECMEDRLLITRDDRRHEAKLPRVRPAFKAARDAAHELDDAVERAQGERDDELRRAEEERRRRESGDRERLKRLQDSISRLPVARRVLRATVGGSPSKESLLKVSRGVFTRWRLDEHIVVLNDLHRYLCIFEETASWVGQGLLYWISFVERGVVHQRELLFRDFPWTLEVEGVWEEELRGVGGRPRCNLNVTLRKYLNHEVVLDCWFTVAGLEVLKYEWKLPAESQAEREDFGMFVSENEDGIRDKITRMLAEPFTYGPGIKLTGTRLFFDRKSPLHHSVGES